MKQGNKIAVSYKQETKIEELEIVSETWIQYQGKTICSLIPFLWLIFSSIYIKNCENICQHINDLYLIFYFCNAKGLKYIVETLKKVTDWYYFLNGIIGFLVQ